MSDQCNIRVHELNRARCWFGAVYTLASFCQKLPAGTLDWIEEVIRDESPESYAHLRRLTNVPFAIGEEFSSQHSPR